MPAPTYQDVVRAYSPFAAWALVEASGLDFAPYIGSAHLTGTGTFTYQQTGPFAASLGLDLAVAAKLAAPALPNFSPPACVETWFRLAAYPPTTTVLVWYWGNSGVNGSGVYIDTSGNLHSYSPASTPNDVNTGVAIGPGWHLVQSGNTANSAVSQVALDGNVIWQGSQPGGTTGSPNQFFWGGSSGAGATRALSLSYPALSFTPMSSERARLTWLAVTDPASAFAQTQAGAGSLLEQIYAAVHKEF